MQKDEFQIGTEFYTGAGRWRCTDVGLRTIAAIKLDHDEPSWYNGPPYAVVEHLFDENDLEACALEPYPDVDYGAVARDRQGQVTIKFHLESRHFPVILTIGNVSQTVPLRDARLFRQVLEDFASRYGIALIKDNDVSH
jgi:hypothetical protein